jgi:hypothetical protein
MNRNILVLAAIVITGAQASAQGNFNVGIGVNYSNGNGFGAMGAPMFGYGAGANFGNVATSCFPPTGPAYPMPPQMPAMPMMPTPPIGMNGGGGFPFPGGMPGMGGMGMGAGMGSGLPLPAMASLPPSARSASVLVPPHIAYQNMGWGPGWGSYPGPGYAQVPSCVPCMAGMQPMPLMPVPGGPAVTGSCGSVYGTCGGASGVGMGAQQIVIQAPRNEWNNNDTAAIVAANGMALGLQTTNIFPIAYPRNEPMITTPTWYQTGTRDFNLVPRSHGP